MLMPMRTGLMGLAGVLVAAGAAAARPPGLPPHVEGREPTPIAREFHEPDAVVPAGGTVPALPRLTWTPDVTPLAGLITGVYDVMLNRLTVPLGAVPVPE
jgi:hypothetical protein